MNPLRTFIAIDFPEPIQEAIEKQITRLRRALGAERIRWIPVQNMHLTLKFIGNTTISHLDFLKQMIARTADACPPFELQIGGFGSFPNWKRVRILWVGIHAPADLPSLQKKLEDGVSRLGYEKEARPFSPHLTIGRVRQGVSPADIQKIGAAAGSMQLGAIGAVRVDSVHLYQSELHSEGSVYTRLFSAPLKKNQKEVTSERA
jgi:RNA 2',3'-cyclic 3'-phosphodiesterase